MTGAAVGRKAIPTKTVAKLINESSAVPGNPSRFARPQLQRGKSDRNNIGGTNGLNNGGINLDAAVDNESSFCEQLLIGGFVQSYVDFFHLTHRTDPSVVDPTHTGERIKVSIQDMVFIRNNLVQAEADRRQGNTDGVYSAFNRLADFYEQQGDFQTALFFHEKCLDIGTMTSDVRAEMSANHALGVVYQKLHNYEAAASHHEQHEQIANTMQAFDEIVKANTQLYKVYTLLADDALEAEEAPDTNAVVEWYHRSLTAAQKSMDKAAEGEANAKIGMLLLKLGNTAESVPYLRQQSQIAADNGNPESRCRACSALALAFDTLGNADKALAELMLVSTISEQAGDIMLQSQANRALGTLYSKVGQKAKSVEALSKHFDLLKTIISKRGEIEAAKNVTLRDLDLARLYVGVAKGNLFLGDLFAAIQYDFQAVLSWKLTRSLLPHKEPSPPLVAAAEEVGAEDATPAEVAGDAGC